ncbi:hypothetical protein [Fischerella sp. PCC 9605]
MTAAYLQCPYECPASKIHSPQQACDRARGWLHPPLPMQEVV